MCKMKTCSSEVIKPTREEDGAKGKIVKAIYRKEGNQVEGSYMDSYKMLEDEMGKQEEASLDDVC